MHKTTTALALFLLMSLLLTYPLALHLADAVEDRQDALLNVWIAAWDGHQLLDDPLHLFDANIFYPYSRTLAYSELLLGHALLGLPITVATGNPVLGYNIALLASFVLSALGTYLLVLQLTRSRAGGLVAGTIYAFSAYRLSNLAQAQLLTTQWMPFALLALYQLLHHPRARHAVTFTLFFCLQALSSFYYGILLSLAALGFVLWWLVTCRPRAAAGLRRSLAYLLVTGGTCVLLLMPFALPYFRVQRQLGFERTLADSEPFSASLQQYGMVPPGSVLYGHLLPSDETPIAGGYPVDALFPGLAAMALALWGLIRGKGRTRWFFFLLLLAAVCLSLGPRLYLAPGRPSGLEVSLPYAWLYAILPGFKALRAPARFDALVTLSLAVLAGYGVGALRPMPVSAAQDPRHGPPPSRAWRQQAWIAALLAGLVVLESWVWPAAKVELVPVGDRVPPVYRWLAGQASAPLLELPMAFAPGGPQLDYQYLSTYHWQPTPDGYSGFIPPKHGQIVYEMERFPSERSLSLLQALGVRTVLLHTDRMPARRWQEIQAALPHLTELSPVGDFGTDQVWQLQPRSSSPGDLQVGGYLPPRAQAGQPYVAYVIALNRGPRSYAVRPTDLLHPTVRWQNGQEAAPTTVQADLPLVTSSEGGAAVIPLSLIAPAQPGTYRLTVGEKDGPLGDWDVQGTVEVGDQGHDAFPVPAQLAEWTVPPAAHAGEPLPIGLTWRALGKIDAYYSIYVKLLDPQGNAIAGWDGQPGNGAAPTLLWVPGETIEEQVTLLVPPETPPGDYRVEVGMYRAEDLARALTLNAEGVPVDRVEIGHVRVGP